MFGEHRYEVRTEWLGDRGEGTASYRSYGRELVTSAAGKTHVIEGSSDRVFHGNAERWNPEELLIAALSECHMLSYLHMATKHGVIVRGYRDAARGTMEEDGRGGGAFVEVVLRPVVEVADASMIETAGAIHAEAAERCFIAASVAFPVRHEPTTRVWMPPASE